MNLVTESTETGGQSAAEMPWLSSLADADLLDAWRKDRHATALAVLVDRYSVMVLSVCRRRCRSAADADDAFQSTFLYLARNCDKIRRPERLAGWLHRVAQRAAVATLKSSKRETEPMVEPVADPDDPLDRLTQRHEAIVLDEELAELPEHYRSAIVLHLYEGYPIQQLADHLGTTIGSVRGRLQRGKQLLAQRLRRRGVVPVLAIAAANASIVSDSQASIAGERFVDATCDGSLPEPPIESTLLESLLTQGIRLMPGLYTAAGLLGGTALVALMVTVGPPPTEATQWSMAAEPNEAPIVAQLGISESAGGSALGSKATTDESAADASSKPAPLQWAERLTKPAATSKIADQVHESLDESLELDVATTLDQLPSVLSEAAGIPVLIDERGVAFAKIQSDQATVQFAGNKVPLRTALRRMLRPLGLQAVVEQEGLVITADPSVLVHQGIGTSRWINIDDDAEQEIAAKLDTKVNFSFIEAPLAEAVDAIAEEQELPILIDRRALEEIGLSAEEPISASLSQVKLRNALTYLLRDLDLTITVFGESLVVTTIEAAEQKLATRIYWLEGTGFAVGDTDRDFQSIIDLIQTSIEPDTWEALGGPSTMAPINSTRPALMISSIYSVHQDIEQLFETLRDTHFGDDPVLEQVQVPAVPDGSGLGGGGFF